MKFTKSYIKDYPRPSLVRDQFMYLNGTWGFCFDEEDQGIENKWYQGFESHLEILVPYVYSTLKSGIHLEKRVDVIWYKKQFIKDSDLNHILHLEGSDDHTMIWVNSMFIGENLGGYERISFDITHALQKGDNEIIIRVKDDFKTDKPRGKQRWKDENFGCWYHETTGIWKSVWIEYVDQYYIKDLYITTNLDNLLADIHYEINQVCDHLWIDLKIEYDGKMINHVKKLITSDKDFISLSIINNEDQFKVKTWNNDHPNLYDLTVTITDQENIYDHVLSYFGVRKWATINRGIYLNDEPVYLKMLLDQGYWKDSGLTPDNEEAIIKDILLTKEMGFNGIRKHQKIEDDRFYYFCDVFGLYVWLEMPSAYEYNVRSVKRITKEWTNILLSHQFFPSIMTYVLFNESWGVHHILDHQSQQQFTVSLYHLTKTIDPSRFVISNDGWEHTLSDLVTIHNYLPYKKDLEKAYGDMDKILSNQYVKDAKVRLLFANGYSYQNQPIIFSEYGGIAFESENGWGYGNQVKNEEEFINRLSGLTEAIIEMKDVSGYCLTQTTDVEQEINGLLTPDREPKVDIKHIQKINKSR